MVIAALIGFVFGFVGSVPVAGPIAALVFARAVEGRDRNGLGIALGAALAESVYAFLAFWGFSTLLAGHPMVLPVSRALAAVILIGLGVIFVRRGHRPPTPDGKPAPALRGGFALGFLLTALNPTLLVTWAAAATTLFSSGLVTFRPGLAVPFAVGACIGIVAWFALLLRLVGRHRHRLSARALDRTMRGMGVGILAIGLYFAALFGQWLLDR